jgi:hypothetical protein
MVDGYIVLLAIWYAIAYTEHHAVGVDGLKR